MEPGYTRWAAAGGNYLSRNRLIFTMMIAALLIAAWSFIALKVSKSARLKRIIARFKKPRD
jgi:hypothetical protein